MIKQRSFQNYLFFLIAICSFSCTNRNQVDVDNIKVSVEVERFDQDMKQLTPENLSSKIPGIQNKYPAFFADYIEGMLNLGSIEDTSYFKNLRTVLRNRDYKELEQSVNEKFPSLKKTEEELTDAFKHIRYYYPRQKLPRVISFFSGFSVQVPVGDDYIGIGLDMFLGPDSKFYPSLKQSIPLYISRRFTPEHITPRVIETLVREELFPEKDDVTSLLDNMVYNGKIMYLMDAIMPDVADTLKIGYTPQQLDWCKTYEASIWGYFLEENLLFETDHFKYQKYLNEAPFTPGIGERNESAPKLGVFIGWQIVKKYMEKNPDVSLQQLMEENDAQKILKESKYKPK